MGSGGPGLKHVDWAALNRRALSCVQVARARLPGFFDFITHFQFSSMHLSSLFRRSLWLVLPAALAFTACSSDSTPAPAQGRVNTYHAAASANIGLKVLFDDTEKSTITYGNSTGYQALSAGSHTIKVNVASSGANILTQPVTVEKDKSYSYFVYANSTTTQAGLLTTDDLTAPASGKAKIRLVNLGQGAANPVKLSTTVAAVADIPGTEAAFGAASPYVEILPGAYNIAVTTGATSATVTNGNVGNGTGAGTVANKTYEAGKIYTVIYRGITGTTVSAELQPKVFIVQQN